MKNKLGIILLLTSSIMGSAFAQTTQYCPQGSAKFLEVAKDYNACNSVVGSDSNACRRFCEDTDRLSGQIQVGDGCSADQIRSIQAQAIQQGMQQGIQQGRNEILRDLTIKEEAISLDYFGFNEDDCARRANLASQALKMEVIRRCNDKAVSIKNCFITSERVSGSAGRPPKFNGDGNFEEKDERSNETDCRRIALANATSQALKKCSEATGTDCTIIDSETIVSHKLKKPTIRIFGARDTRICDAKVFAEAPRDLAYKCNLRISARNQASSN